MAEGSRDDSAEDEAAKRRAAMKKRRRRQATIVGMPAPTMEPVATRAPEVSAPETGTRPAAPRPSAPPPPPPGRLGPPPPRRPLPPPGRRLSPIAPPTMPSGAPSGMPGAAETNESTDLPSEPTVQAHAPAESTDLAAEPTVQAHAPTESTDLAGEPTVQAYAPEENASLGGEAAAGAPVEEATHPGIELPDAEPKTEDQVGDDGVIARFDAEPDHEPSNPAAARPALTERVAEGAPPFAELEAGSTVVLDPNLLPDAPSRAERRLVAQIPTEVEIPVLPAPKRGTRWGLVIVAAFLAAGILVGALVFWQFRDRLGLGGSPIASLPSGDTASTGADTATEPEPSPAPAADSVHASADSPGEADPTAEGEPADEGEPSGEADPTGEAPADDATEAEVDENEEAGGATEPSAEVATAEIPRPTRAIQRLRPAERRRRAVRLRAAGQRHYDADRFAEAEQSFLEALMHVARDAPSTEGMSRTLARQERHAEAIAWAELAVSRWPRSASSYRVLGDALRAANRDDDARAAYRRGLRVAPRDRWLRQRIADLD